MSLWDSYGRVTARMSSMLSMLNSLILSWKMKFCSIFLFKSERQFKAFWTNTHLNAIFMLKFNMAVTFWILKKILNNLTNRLYSTLWPEQKNDDEEETSWNTWESYFYEVISWCILCNLDLMKNSWGKMLLHWELPESHQNCRV